MEVDGSSKDIGTRKSLERQLCPVCTAANGLHLGGHAGIKHRFLGALHDVHHGLYLVEHVVILVTYLNAACAGTILVIYPLCHRTHEDLALLKELAVVVAYDIGKLCRLAGSAK